MTLLAFLSGAVAFGFILSSLFFLRFWRETRDPLFIAFSIRFFFLELDKCSWPLAGYPMNKEAWYISCGSPLSC